MFGSVETRGLQLLFLDRIPAHAAVSATVDLAKRHAKNIQQAWSTLSCALFSVQDTRRHKENL